MRCRNKIKLLPVVLCFIFQNVYAAIRVDPLVDTKIGLIRGLRANDGDYSMFMGIPYATVDKGNPFGPSIPHPGFDEIFEAYDDSAICPQIEEFNNTIVGTLDCLHINVYVPDSASSRNRLPVLVWIYGGGFEIGFAGRYLYGPSYLVRHDIILVTLNYRVGPYGFMCLDTPEVPGNQGLKDQQTALKWVKDNIAPFGGDDSKITIFGESAGGASVDVHLLYSQEKLFDKVIMQSGTTECPWAFTDPDKSAPIKLAGHLGFATNDVAEALSFLSTIDTNLVIASTLELNIVFRPCLENDFENAERLISDHPINIKIPNVKNMPVLLGHNNDERLVLAANDADYFQNENVFYNFLEGNFNFQYEELIEMEEIIRHFYVGDEDITENVKWDIINFESDNQFSHPTVRSIPRYIENSAKDIFFYVFSYNGSRNFVKNRLNMTIGGAAHADEISYLFHISYMVEDPTPEDQLIIDRITTLWANFVKYGDPTPETSDLIPVKWSPVSADTLYFLDIDSEMTVGRRPFRDRMVFLDLFYKYNQKARKGYQETNQSLD